MCGTNRQSYANLCQLKHEACSSNQTDLRLLHLGHCGKLMVVVGEYNNLERSNITGLSLATQESAANGVSITRSVSSMPTTFPSVCVLKCVSGNVNPIVCVYVH